MSSYNSDPTRISIPAPAKGAANWKQNNEILPYSLMHQNNHMRCKELYPNGFSYVGGSSGTIGFGKGLGRSNVRFSE